MRLNAFFKKVSGCIPSVSYTHLGSDYNRVINPGEIMVLYGHARKGFEYPLIKFAVITESDIFGQEQKKKKKKKVYNGKDVYKRQELDWFLLGEEKHRDLKDFVQTLLKMYRKYPALYGTCLLYTSRCV